ncbi:MAG: hypothetical protein Faunusvirus18_3 [Faunusvirus sp.]|jgi:hypothetical protein|uniref:Uncharacterized protein n=1 Tax=Faunusvirus sp. TaxID=2487766 RepID=A0A3G4ZX54_9VIRU|nr:MAG: hypothetical protein Faunusvirus18_3 [Faunusvirus sp.]
MDNLNLFKTRYNKYKLYSKDIVGHIERLKKEITDSPSGNNSNKLTQLIFLNEALNKTTIIMKAYLNTIASYSLGPTTFTSSNGAASLEFNL